MTPKLVDYGHRGADKKLMALIRRLNLSYRQARINLSQKIEDYLAQFEKDDAMMRALYDSGELSHEDYTKWKYSTLAGTKQWKNMLNQLSDDLTHQNEIAASMINDTLPDVYALNHNYGTYEAEKGSGYDTTYTLYDKNVVKQLLTEHGDLLPQPSVPIEKDKLWNRQHLQSAMLQGILTGESMKDIAKRFQSVTGMTENAAIRNARTAVTGAENAGRVDSYIRAEKMGIKMKQMWMATLDSRTRDSHAILDGEQQEVGKEFSNGCRYPGDPKGRPEEVYNCRCTLVAVVDGADPYNPNLRPSEYLQEQGLTYDEWKQMHQERYEAKLTKNSEELSENQIPIHHVINGKDISGTWQRRPDKFAFAIDDVINAQGFDGLPRVVSQAEFDKAVKLANGGDGFIAQRTYSAQDQETLDLYREQLYKGKWYVDCSSGSAMHGRGMYAVGNYGLDVTDTMKTAMVSYGANSPFAYVETFTLENDAKIIKENDIKNLLPDLGDNLIKKHIEKYGLSEEDMRFISASSGVGHIENMQKMFNSNPKRATELMKMRVENSSFNSDILSAYNEYLDISKDNGVIASLFGYDAIDCGRTQDYFVILNRTKVVFRGN